MEQYVIAEDLSICCAVRSNHPHAHRQERSIKAPFFMHGCLCQKACAGAHHFKGALPLNSKRRKKKKEKENAD